MKIYCFYIGIVFVFLFSCQEKKDITLEEVLTKYSEKVESIDKLSYNIRRVDTFSQGGAVWDNKGFAHLEKRTEDTIFGFSFYGKRDDVPVISIYDQGKTFTLDQKEMMYELGKGGFYYMGSPGGQMVATSFFGLDDEYQSRELVKSDENYTIKYTFPDDTTYLVTNRIKMVELNADFIPVKIKSSSLVQGEKSTTDLIFSDIKINENTSSSLENYKDKIKEYTLLMPEEDVPSIVLGKKLPITNLTELRTGKKVSIDNSKIVLLDFWETWCGWCIKAFPDVEELKKTYSEDLVVYGISTEDKDKAIELLDKKKVTFSNYFEDASIHDTFEVNSFPKYYLVDKNGVIVKEYFGFSDNIERDIQVLIN
ncbi:TlpA family protein disulfide reductase [Winogradskyella sp.]|uniref:TlpA family protein disulfide reductase n=1 Tax=Winogradskyella sp. TaxID=1883156 RepID=UPI003F6A5A7B